MTEVAGRALAIDLGSVRVGLAVSDLLRLTVRPIEPYRCVGPRKDVNALAEVVREHEVTTVVVGLPLHLSGEEGEGAAAAREFASLLRRRIPKIEIKLWDERLTSVEAERLLVEGKMSRRKRKSHVDGVAAALILQSYLESPSGAEDVTG